MKLTGLVRLLIFFLFPLTALILAGCSITQQDKADEVRPLLDYNRSAAPKESGLLVPPDLSGVDNGTEGAEEQADESDAVTATAVAELGFPNVRIVRDGQARWLEVEGTPNSVWPEVRDFWVSQNVPLALDSPLIGIIETEWLENKARYSSPLQRLTKGLLGGALGAEFLDKYRFRLEAGTRPDTTEVYVTHRGMQRVFADDPKVAPKYRTGSNAGRQLTPPNLEYEIEIMRLLAAHLGGAGQQEIARMIKQLSNQKADESVVLQSDEDEIPYLLVKDDVQKTWMRVGLALDRAGVIVAEKDQQRGVYRFQLTDEQAQQAQKRGIFGSRKRKSKNKNEGEEREAMPAFEAHLEARADGSTAVRLYEEDGSTLLAEATDEVEAKALYDLLYEQLL